jgi:hypothetical protein
VKIDKPRGMLLFPSPLVGEGGDGGASRRAG